MPRPRPLLARALVLVAALACGPTAKEPGAGAGQPRGGLVPTPTPRGAPLARTITTTLAAAGGTLATSDGALTVSVPAGALPSPTDVTITPIANTARGAIGGAFRLGPEGQTFSAPVTLTFKAPEKYPPGASIGGVGVEYQDRRGFWHKVEPVARDAGAKTVSVTTDHFSDWALTWQTGTAAAEGPIRLVQTVDVPFDAFGRATVYYQGESATTTTYLLTGTLTVPETVVVRDEVCVPDQRTKTLPLNVAELRRGDPAVFSWGIGAFWSLSCTAPNGAVTTRLMPALFDTMYINLTRCGGYYEPGQVATPERMAGAYTKNCGFEGLVSATWDLRACVEGLACDPGGICRAGTTACTDGIASCPDTGPAPNGTSCGPTDNLVCSEAQCVDLLDQEVGFTVTPVADLTTSESGGSATFQIVLNKAPTIAVSVELSTDSPEGSVSPASVTFTPVDWNVPQTVTVRGNDDFVDDGDVAYRVVTAPATSVDPRYGGRDPDDVQVLNVDDDVAGILLGSSSGLVTTEGGGAATFQVALSSQPVADVTIDLSSGDTTEGTVAPATVTFTAATWNQPQAVTVTGVDDLVDDGAVAYTVALVASSADPSYAARTAGASVTNDDNDTAGLTVSPTAGLATSEPGGTASFTVALQSEPVADVTVPIVSTNEAEGVPSVAQLVFTPADWNVPQTVTVTGVQDSVADGPVVYGVTVGPPETLDTVYVAVPATLVELTNGDEDVAGITVEPPTGIATAEGGASVSFAVVLTSQPLADVSIPVSSGDATEASVSPALLTFTAETWNVPQTVTVAGVDDRTADGDQLFDVVIGAADSADPKYEGIDPGDVRLANADDDVAGFAISPSAGLVTTEAGGTATFQLALTSQPFSDVSVTLSSGDVTEASASPATLTFTAADWEVPQTVTLTGRDDAVADGTIAYSVAVAATSADGGYEGRTGTVSATNEDDDAVGMTVSPTDGLVTTEAGGAAAFTVVLHSEPTAPVTIRLASTDAGEGTPGVAQLVFTAADWSVAQLVTVTGADDRVADGPVAYAISVGPTESDDPAYAALAAASVAVTNADDDVVGVAVGAPSSVGTSEAGTTVTFTVALTSEPTAPVTIPVSSSDTTEGTVAPGALTFTAADWSVPQTVTVTGVDDLVDDGDQLFTAVLGLATSADPGYSGLDPADVPLSNADDDAAGFAVLPASGIVTSEPAGAATFQLALSSEPVADVTVALSSSDATEGAPSPASVTFTPATWNAPQTITVTGADDAVADGAVAYVVALAAASEDATYGGRAGAVPVTNADDDVAGVLVSAPSGASTAEAGTAVTFTVALRSEPTAPVTLPLASGDATEGTASPAALTFTAADWSAPQTVTVTGADDRVDDGDQPFAVVLGPSESGDASYAGILPAEVQLTNVDDDAAGLAFSQTSGLVTTEVGGSATFQLSLTSEPTADVTFAVSSGDDTEASAAPGSVTFTAADWDLPQTVTVTGRDDAVADGAIAYAVTVAATSADPGYQGRTGTVSATNEDDDAVGLVVSPTSGLTTSEAGGAAAFTVALRSEPTAPVMIRFASTDPGEGTPSAAELTFTAADWSVAQTVTVTGADDLVADGPAAYAITVGPPESADAAYAALAAASVALTNADDDVVGVVVGAPSDVSTSEAGTTVTFTVALATEPTAPVSIPVSSSDPTEGSVSPAALTFTAADWDVPQTVTVTGVDDLVDDGDQLFAAVLGVPTSADPSYSGLDPADVQLANGDDDAAGFTVLPAAGIATSEPTGAATFQLSLSSEPLADVTVALSSSDATEGAAAPASVTFTPVTWSVPQTITVTGADDAVADGPVAYAVQLAATSDDASYGGRTASVPATNGDDDAAGIAVSAPSGASTAEAGTAVTFTVVLRSEPTAPVTLPVSSGDATEATVGPTALTFTAETWNVPQVVTVTGADDHVDDGDQPFTVAVGPSDSGDPSYAGLPAADVQLTNLDDDAAGLAVSAAAALGTTEAGGSAAFQLSLSSEPTADVTVALSTSDATEGSVSPASLTFTPATWNVAQPVTVSGADDPAVDGPVEYAIQLAATSADPGYEGRTSSVAVTNADDDVAGFALSPAALATTEAGGTATLQVALSSQPAADVTVTLSTSDATEGAVSPASLVFSATTWDVAQPVTVTGLDDAVADGPVAYLVQLVASSADPDYAGRAGAASASNADDDVAGFAVSPPTATFTTEGGGSVTFTIALTSQPTADVTIPLSSSDPDEATVSPASVVFTPGDWSAARTVTVAGVQDLVADGEQPVTIALGAATSGDAGYAGLDATDLALTNRDDDVAGLVLSPASGLATTEAGGTATFEVSLSSQPVADVTLALSSSDAGEGDATPGSVVFGATTWNVPRTITVTGADDAVDDGEAPYAILLAATSADAGYDGRTASVSAANADDDTAGIAVSSPTGTTTSEAGTSVSFTVVLTSQPTADVTIPLSSSDASEGTASTPSLVFTTADWSVAKTVTVTGADDAVDDGDQPFTVVLGAATSADAGYAGRDPADVPLTNADDDTAGIAVSPPTGTTTSEAGTSVSFTVVLTSQPTADVTIPLSSSDASEGTASTPSLVFTAADWSVAKTVTVTGVDDVVDDGDQPFTVVIGAATSADASYGGADPADVLLTNVDDDAAGFAVSPPSGLTTTEAGGTATFQLALSSRPSADVTVALSSGDAGEGAVAPASVTFGPDTWNQAQPVTVTGVDDLVDDGAVAYAIHLAATSTDPGYGGRTGSVGITNADDDVAGIAVSPPSGASTSEGGTSVTFTVALTSQPLADVTVALSSSDETEGALSVASVTFTAADWSVARDVAVTGVGDLVDDGDQPFAVIVGPATSTDPAYGAIAPAQLALTNTDDDTAGLVLSRASGLATTEAGGAATFDVSLSSEPTAAVTVSLSSSDGTEGAVSPTSLLFTASDWSTVRTVTVAGLDDAEVDGAVAYEVRLSAASADAGYDGRTASVSAANADDEAALIVSPAGGLETSEAGGTASFTVALNSQPAAEVRVAVASSDTTEGTVSAAELVFTTTSWSVAQPVTVTGVDDLVADGPAAYALTLGPPSSADPRYAALAPVAVSAANVDDDLPGIAVSPPSGAFTSEGGTSVTFTVVLTSQPLEDVTVPLSSSDPTEGAVSAPSLLFTPESWSVAQVVTVTGVDDLVDDGDQLFGVAVGPATSTDASYAGIDPEDLLFSNTDDDLAGIEVSAPSVASTSEGGATATFTVVLASEPLGDVTVPLSSSDTTEGTLSAASLTFTPASWGSPQIVTVTGVDDLVDDGDQVFTVVVGAATSTDPSYAGRDPADLLFGNTDDDVAGLLLAAAPGLTTTEGGGAAAFEVSLSSEPTAAVTVSLSSSDGGEGTVSPSEVVFTATDWQVPRTVTVTGADDADVDGAVAYAVQLAAASADPGYEGRTASVPVTNVDDEAALVVSPTSGLVTTESGRTVSFTVVLHSQPTGEVRVPVESSDASEGTVSVPELVFTTTTWDVAQTVSVRGMNDLVVDGTVPYAVTLGPPATPDARYAALAPVTVSAVNLDDDIAGISVSSASGSTTSEAGTSVTFTVLLTSQPTADVTLPLSSSNPAEGTVSAPALVFTPSSWNVVRTVTVTGVDDRVDDGDQPFTVVVGPATSTDPTYAGRDPTDIPLTNLDDDVAGIAVSPPSGASTSEGGTSVSFTVVLESEPTADVRLPVSSGDTAEGVVSADLLTFTPGNWSTPQTVTVTGVDDAADDGDVPYAISVGPSDSSDPSYAGFTFEDLQLVNVDDDPPPEPTAQLPAAGAGG